jgi:hypothetical protein
MEMIKTMMLLPPNDWVRITIEALAILSVRRRSFLRGQRCGQAQWTSMFEMLAQDVAAKQESMADLLLLARARLCWACGWKTKKTLLFPGDIQILHPCE